MKVFAESNLESKLPPLDVNGAANDCNPIDCNTREQRSRDVFSDRFSLLLRLNNMCITLSRFRFNLRTRNFPGFISRFCDLAEFHFSANHEPEVAKRENSVIAV